MDGVAVRDDMGQMKRDPVSELFDPAARKLLSRALQHKGTWQATRIADPSLKQRRWLEGQGIDWTGPDNASATGTGGGLDARDRWTRAFVRALYYQFKWYSVIGGDSWRATPRGTARHAGALRVDVGRRLPVKGIIPAGRAIRVQYAAGGSKSLAVVQQLPDRDRIYTDDARPAGRYSDPALRDW